MTTPVVHDCDPGNDDALGILVAAGHPGLDLVAVTTGAGHLAADRTAANAAIALAVAEQSAIPVSAGASLPLVRERLIASLLDGDGGLDAERHDLPAVPLDPRHSVDLIADMAAAWPGLTIVTTGPLTNLALALRLDSDLARHIGRVVILGGAWGLGNKTAAAEWNILCDPEAAAIVCGSGVPITMIPIDATAAVMIDGDLVEEMERVGGPVGRLALELTKSLTRVHRPAFAGPMAAPLNDPLALLVAAEPGLARTIPARVDIELGSGRSYGRTIVDFACRDGRPANCDIVVAFDVPATRAAFVASLVSLAETTTVQSQEEGV